MGRFKKILIYGFKPKQYSSWQVYNKLRKAV